MPGDRWQQLANLRALLAWMWAHPGKKLLFMGAEMAQDREWSHDRSLDWHLLQHPSHAGVDKLLKTLNLLYRERPALWQQDFEWTGFSWIDANDSDNNVLSFVRYPTDRDDGAPLACVANLSPVVREGYRIGVPRAGWWREALNTDATDFWGSGVVNGAVEATDSPWHGFDHSLELTLPPLAVVWLEPE
jgi:1,4-alpha-glucan branching enzyme